MNLENICDKIAKDNCFAGYNIVQENVSATGSYLSEAQIVTIKETDGKKQINLFVKKALPWEDDESFVQGKLLYEREKLFYNDIRSKFNEIEGKFAVPEVDCIRTVKLYRKVDDYGIVMENMVMKGYTNYDSLKPITLKYAKKALKEMAKLHALSFATEKYQPEFFDNKIKSLNIPHGFGDSWKDYITKSMAKDVTIMKSDEAKRKVTELMSVVPEKLPCACIDSTLKHGFCHGDYRVANILMKEMDGEIEDLIPVDYQVIHYGPIVNDLCYFIYVSTDTEFREKHLDEILESYRNDFTHYLRNFDIDSEDVYSREQFDKEWKKQRMYALMQSFMLLPLFVVSKDSMPDLSEPKNHVPKSRHPEYIRRINALVEEYIKLGLI